MKTLVRQGGWTGRKPRLIRVFAGHMSFCWFCRAAAHLSLNVGRVTYSFKNVPALFIYIPHSAYYCIRNLLVATVDCSVYLLV